MKVNVTITYLDFEGGFWGLVADDGKKYMPLNMPEQLKSNGAKANVTLEPVEDAVTIQMWGRPVRITGFHTLPSM